MIKLYLKTALGLPVAQKVGFRALKGMSIENRQKQDAVSGPHSLPGLCPLLAFNGVLQVSLILKPEGSVLELSANRAARVSFLVGTGNDCGCCAYQQISCSEM